MLLKSDNSISKQMELLKVESAFWINKTVLQKTQFEWADKYFAASVSNHKIDVVSTYINNQQTHRLKQTFTEEYKSLLCSLGY
ncbi:MAG: transposase [Flavobacterium sp.]|nr:transposase [Flavobacterium sp.]